MIRTLQLVTTPRPFFEQQITVLERNGVSCTVLSVPGETGERTYADYVRCYGQLLRTLRAGEFDLVHANYGLTGPMALAQPVRPVVLSLWGSDLMGSVRPVSKVSARLSDAVVVMSEEMAAELAQDCAVVPHGVDTDLFTPAPRESAIEAVGWRPDAAHVLFPYDPDRDVKNYPRAERVVERVRADVDRPVELHAVFGEPHDRLPTYMNAADVLLLTSHREGSPNAVKEALACDLPVVATPVGDVPDLLDGLPVSTVRESDSQLAAGVIAALTAADRTDGRERALELGLDRMERGLLSVYERALGTGVTGRE